MSENFKRKLRCIQFSKKTNENIYLISALASLFFNSTTLQRLLKNLGKTFSLVFWENWRQRNFLMKFSHLQYIVHLDNFSKEFISHTLSFLLYRSCKCFYTHFLDRKLHIFVFRKKSPQNLIFHLINLEILGLYGTYT